MTCWCWSRSGGLGPARLVQVRVARCAEELTELHHHELDPLRQGRARCLTGSGRGHDELTGSEGLVAHLVNEPLHFGVCAGGAEILEAEAQGHVSSAEEAAVEPVDGQHLLDL